MTPRLSIIIPCYNCASTLSEAVVSCFAQGLDPATFEIIMVDDGSTDTTKAVMKTLADTYNNIKLIFHPENRGGGAARNTGIKASLGNIIYCLDSDNFFAPQSVKSMLNYLESNELDGVAYYERRYFNGTSHTKYNTHINTKPNVDIEISDIFSLSNHILLDNFFYTKEAYNKTAGYPEHHGFDTQCFEMRFLAAGNRVQVCPASVFFHRQDTNRNSYFERVYKQGYFSRNFYLICEDIFYLFSINTRRIIMDFDAFQNTKLDSHNLKAKLDQKLQAEPEDFLIPEYRTYLSPTGRSERQDLIRTSTEPEDIFTTGVLAYQDGDLVEAFNSYNSLLLSGTDSPIIYFNLLRCHLASTKKYPKRRIEDEVQRLVVKLNPKTQTLSRIPNIVRISASKIRSIWS